MKIKHALATICIALAVLTGCKKDKDVVSGPDVKLSITDDVISGTLNQKIVFSASVAASGQDFQQQWKLNGEVKSTTGTYEFTPISSGSYVIEYSATNKGGTFSHTYKVNVGAPVTPVTPGSNMYVTNLFEFSPAPGQFINKGPGNLESAQGILGKDGGMVSLGAWGGYIVLGFDHTVINQPDKEDILVGGNPLPNFAEPGIIWVMQDENGNGKPDDTWYEVAGNEFGKAGYVRNYEVTYTRPTPANGRVAWSDNKGNSGFVETNRFHTQPYYPDAVTANQYTLKGSLLPSGNIDMSNPSFITSAPFAWGYADNTVGGDKIDIANAVDKDGRKVNLSGIDFIKIQTGIQANMGWLGEQSTEVTRVVDISLMK